MTSWKNYMITKFCFDIVTFKNQMKIYINFWISCELIVISSVGAIAKPKETLRTYLHFIIKILKYSN